MKPGILYVVPTPLGNLQDITLRALHVLGKAPILAAEDTRTAQRLLESYQLWPLGSQRKLFSYFQGNEQVQTQNLIEFLHQGLDVALLSEAGTPGISDPGHPLIQMAISKNIEVDVLPGANAIIPSVILSGFSSESFLFLGFPPTQEEKRYAFFNSIHYQKATLVFFESPSRIQKTLTELSQILGNEREACVVRELTKMYQQILRGTLQSLQEHFTLKKAKGEITFVVKGFEEISGHETDVMVSVEEEIKNRLIKGQSPKEIAALLSLLRGKPKRQIYQAALFYQGQLKDDIKKEIPSGP